jgi:hypothetical protein
MGGVWVPATTNSSITPIMWREQFPADIVQDLVSFDNPDGSSKNHNSFVKKYSSFQYSSRFGVFAFGRHTAWTSGSNPNF